MFSDNNKGKGQPGIGAGPAKDNSKSATNESNDSNKASGKPDKLNEQTEKTVDLNGLSGLRQRALTDLSPLVDDLDQPPIEKFRLLMMLVQAKDDSSLINKAYQAAQLIENNKERAQALLDVINEINYFTQNQTSEN